MTTILRLKFKRAVGSLVRTPWPALVLLAALIAGVCWFLFLQFPTSPGRFVIWAVTLAGLAAAHNRRKDADFCRLVLLRPRRLFATEYLICCSPMIVLAAITATWDNLAFYTLCPVCVGLMPRKKRSSRPRKPLFFLKTGPVELTSFVRKRFFVLALASLSAAVFCYLPVMSMAILLIFILLMSGAYTENEPLDMLLLPEVAASKYLAQRVWAGFAFFLKLNAPALALYALFNFDTAWLALAVPTVALIGTALSVFVKYSGYDPAGREVAVPSVVSLGMAGIVVPLFLPVTLALTWRYFHSAKETLNRYLYVYD